jgi:hypothetical protein
VYQLELRPGPAGFEENVRDVRIRRAADEVVAELFGKRAGLVQVLDGDRALEIHAARRHQDGEHADLNALIELLGPMGKAETKPALDFDLAHDNPPPRSEKSVGAVSLTNG